MLYYGDNLPILRNRDYFPSESVDLVYLDPPFNSNQDYNVLFAEQDGSRSAAQIRAFTDTWRWDEGARRTYDETTSGAATRVGQALVSLHDFIGESDMLAYLSMMAPRLVELRRVLKPGGSIYLHCDPTASHYLKMVMDAVFGPEHFVNEVIWHYRKWPTGKYAFQSNHDVILFYSRGDSQSRTFNQLYMERAASTLKRFGTAKIVSGHDSSGRRVPSKTEAGDSEGVRLDDVWDLGRVPPIKQLFPTEKPLPLLRRIIEASSRPGETVLDPFCGCGTAIMAAQELDRRWIGIDITHLAITLIRSRLKDAYGDKVGYRVVGEPEDQKGAIELSKQDRYQFQWWSLGKIGARPLSEERKKGADAGIDGKLFFREKQNGPVKTIVIQVKSGGLKLSEIRDFAHVIGREKAQIGVLLALEEPTRDMRAEAASMGYYKPEYRLSQDDKYDRYQILTIRELFEGKQPAYPPFRNVTFKTAPGSPSPVAKPKRRIKKLSLPGFAGQGVLRAEEGEPEPDSEEPTEK
jgi:site-specific DNA-methyltransferase (adenine-specific)